MDTQETMHTYKIVANPHILKKSGIAIIDKHTRIRMNTYIQLNLHIKLSHTVNNTLIVVKKFFRFSLDVGPIQSRCC